MAMSFKLKLLLWMTNTFNRIDVERISPEELRAVADNRDLRILDGPPMKIHKVEDRLVQGSEASIPIRIYTPEKAERLPVIVFFHGGGFVLGNIKAYDKICRRMSLLTKSIIVSVEYRLAPEYKFPAAPTDCLDVTKWVAENAVSMGADPEKLVVMGDSAGGNLAAVTAIQARDQGGPAIAFQVLVYPTVDARMTYPSIEENGKGYILTKDLMTWFTDHYSRTPSDKEHPLMSPILTKDLSGLPPALIQTAGFDPLRDEGIDYAQELKKTGNEVIHTNYEGLVHTYYTMPGFSKKCLSTHLEIGRVLRSFFSNN